VQRLDSTIWRQRAENIGGSAYLCPAGVVYSTRPGGKWHRPWLKSWWVTLTALRIVLFAVGVYLIG
jgi:hypothetical protein